MRASILCLSVVTVATVSCRPTPSGRLLQSDERAAIEQAVLACHDQTIAAAETLDLDRLFSFLAANDRGSMIANGRLFLTRDDTIADTREGFQNLASLKYETHERHVSVLSRTAALLITTGVLHGRTADGRAFSTPYAHSIVFVFQDGVWRVLHLHSSAPIGS